ncbi:MAG: D-alanyl-D-alanine carboxypeptidase family protein [Bacilli bacterium]
MKKKIQCALLGLTILLVGNQTISVQAANDETIVAEYGVSINATTGEVLYNRNADEEAFPASITKVMTALLLVENLQPSDNVPITREATNLAKSNWQIEFAAGEELSRNEALEALMVLSANDVAESIGVRIAGSTREFAQMMNKRARELGAMDSYFQNASGLHTPSHRTTAYDIAMITREAIRHPEILKVMNTRTTTITTSLQEKDVFSRARYFYNDDAIGGKNGYTDEARNTLVQVNERNGMTVITVVMRSDRAHIYDDIQRIAEIGLHKLTLTKVIDHDLWERTFTFWDETVPVHVPASVVIPTMKAKPNITEVIVDTEQRDNSSATAYAAAPLNDITVEIVPSAQSDRKLAEQGIQEGEQLATVNVYFGQALLVSEPAFAAKTVTWDKVMVGEVVVERSKVLQFAIGALVVFLLLIVGVRRLKKKF